MRVALDLTALNANPSGIDRYLVGLARSLAKLERDAQFILFINWEDRARFAGKNQPPPHCQVWPICLRPRLVRLFFQQILLPLLLYLKRIDVLHSPTFIMPAWRGSSRHVLTIHDMSSFLLPETHPALRRGPLYERVVSASIRRAHVVTVPSGSVKADILRIVPEVEAKRIRVIPCGIDDEFRRRDVAEIAPVLQRLEIPTPYILYLGTLEPRKNLPHLLAAFAKLRAAGHREHLVLGGAKSWSQSAFDELHQREGVRLLGYVAEADLPLVYAGAALFVYPSLLEGFGFPPLEAMACGVPVVASDTSSLRENLAGAATLVSPDNNSELAAAMRRLLDNAEARADAIAAGKERADSFRWERFAEATFACYEA